ncbi:MAG TPA: hypothetical protein VL122_09270 [Nitrospirota bacterium]|nr:hypothetical protein [Nitrospirota bacterium]
MPRKITAKKKAKKTVSQKSVKKAVKKKTLKKKSPPPTKKTAKKKTLKKKPLSARRKAATPKPVMVEPGPPPRTIPPVEEPFANEEAIGTITHYYSHLNVAVVQLNKGTLKVGDTIHLKGHTTDFSQTIESMEYEHLHIDQAGAGQSVGIRVKDHAREHDIVYLVK